MNRPPERSRVDAESQSLLEELWATPVGRRWALKAGLTSTAAMAAALNGVKPPAPAQAAQRPKRRRKESRDLHFAYGHLRRVSHLRLVGADEEIPLRRHTKASRAALEREGGLWKAADLTKLSHYVEAVRLPADRAQVLSVHGRHRGRDVVVGHIMHVPQATTRTLARTAARGSGSYRAVAGSPKRLAALGLKRSDVRAARHVMQLDSVGDSHTTASTIAMMHPNVATKDPTNAGVTKQVLGQTSAIGALGQAIAGLQGRGRNFGSLAEAKDADGTPTQIKVGDTTTTFNTFSFTSDAGFQRSLKSAVASGVQAVRDTGSLGAVIDQPLDTQPAASTKTWVQSQGAVPQTIPFAGPAQLGAAGIDINVKNPGNVFGTKVEVNGTYSNGQVPLKLYNNWVRWVWVYVQYIGANDANLSANPNAAWPDTKYCKSLGLLPQVFTVLGIPVWDQNTITVNLDFPDDAHTARLLFCGLGSDINGGGWRQWFPADAYPDKIAPQDEVLFGALITGILTIGLTVFALATDLDIATTWARLRKPIEDVGLATFLSFESIGRLALPAAEGAALAVAGGGETYESIKANGGSTENIWSLLLPIASVIPKIIFNPSATSFWVDVALDITEVETATKIIGAIPLIGEVIAVIEVLGDVATLAEVVAETIVAPWVIENEINLTYPATITVSRDKDEDATWPTTAVSWRLEAKVDGAVTLSPITGSINDGGQIRSDDLVLPVTAPFGGKQIQWSFVVMDAGGNQVGTGVSASYTNNDPNNPPSTVAFSIKELPVPINATTRFKRADTTGYSTAAGGYTWSDQISDSGTLSDKGIQEVAGTAISTLAGVAGVVWEQGNRYYLRGVPVAENGSTITLGAATEEGYARRPFLLLDPFVARGAAGNDVLLEPDPSTPEYHVRKVTLDATTGAPTWDPSVSYGTFPLPMSAATLHSSGRVVVVNTDNGRIGSLLPANTPRPPQATYTAGPGTQTGLLSSPVAVAVTNPGVVLILEAAALQIAAFDLNGNPVQYFAGATASLTRRSLVTRARQAQASAGFTLPLASKGSYLDMGVDGSGQIYVLYYTGDGSAPADYRVDVYSAKGALINSVSTGVNAPHLSVDYWRSIYAANYDPLADTVSGQPRIDPTLDVPEPSLSRFDPVNAKAATLKRRRRARTRRG